MTTPRTIFVTGASRGIGLEFVRQIASRGDRVIAAVRNPTKAAELRSLGDTVRVIQLDVTDQHSIESLRSGIGDVPIDAMINNAGVSSTSKSIATLDGQEIARVFAINSIAPMLVTRALLDNLRAGTRRVVFSITSQLGSIANNTGGSTYAYRASKAALNQLNRSLANELAGENFICVAVHPGWVRTDMGGPNAPLTPHDSVAAMLRTLDHLTAASNGQFLNYDGTPLPW